MLVHESFKENVLFELERLNEGTFEDTLYRIQSYCTLYQEIQKKEPLFVQDTPEPAGVDYSIMGFSRKLEENLEAILKAENIQVEEEESFDKN